MALSISPKSPILKNSKKDILKFLEHNVKNYKILSSLPENSSDYSDNDTNANVTDTPARYNKFIVQFANSSSMINIAKHYSLAYDPVHLCITFKFNPFHDLIVPVIYKEYYFNTLSVHLHNETTGESKWIQFKTIYKKRNIYDKKSQVLLTNLIASFKQNPSKYKHYAEVLYEHNNILTLYPTFGYTVINRKNTKYKIENFFEHFDILGSGKFGKVYTVRLLDPALDILEKKYPYINKKEYYVLKKLWTISDNEKPQKTVCNKFTCDKIPRLLKELRIVDQLTKELKNPNIIRTYGCFLYLDEINSMYSISILMEYAGRYNLSKILSTKALFESIPTNDLWQGLLEISSALEQMHMIKFYHGDIKLHNIVYSQEKNKMKLVDFGLACNLERYPCRDIGGTKSYNLPDADFEQYTHLGPVLVQEIIDKYAFALCVYYIMIGAVVTLDKIYTTEFNTALAKLPIMYSIFVEKKILPYLKLNTAFANGLA
jgi:hypothetical protein